ncbi:MAG: response regulator [Planctomycetota bacterium]|nr:response regulator [Planctomycetota bacterium]
MSATERRPPEDGLRTELEFTQAALDALRDTYFVFEPDTGRAVRWNREFRDVSGYSDEEIAELPAPASYYSPEDIERASAFIRDVLEQGSGIIELELICKDGRRIPTEYKVAIIRTPDGGPRYVISIGRDVTERRQADLELRVERERLLRFMDAATDGFHLLDRDLRILAINQMALDRIRMAVPEVTKPQDVTGRLLVDVYPFLREQRLDERFRPVFESGEPVVYDDSVEHPTLGTVHMTIKAFKVGDEIGLIATDVTERTRAAEQRLDLERQIQHAQKLESLGVLAGGIAHDFNNILVSILGHADLAFEEMSLTAPGRRHLMEIVKGSRRAADLATQMLAYSGKGRFELRTIDLNEFVEEMAHLLTVSTSKKSVVQYEFADALPAIEGDVTQVRQVIMNLITNASEALGADSGIISIRTGVTRLDPTKTSELQVAEGDPEGTYVHLEVVDTGCGMDEATLRRLFDPFYSTKFTGRGLGMAVVQGIVRGHNGAIRVRSRPGEGTEVRVMFPAVEGAAEPLAREPKTDAATWRASGTVLLVDDEESILFLAREMLEATGFDVVTAANGREALQIFKAQPEAFELVLLDLTMPEMDGEECFRELRKIRADVRVVMSSGYSEQEITRRFTGTGLRGFMQKPYRLTALRAKLREALE